MDKKIKILWLSDIHYTDDFLDLFIKNKDAMLKSVKPREIDYIVVSGDLVKRPFKEFFDGFESFLKILNNDFNKAKIFIVPGNHDVQRICKEDINATEEFIIETKKNNKNEYMYINSKCFKDLFTNFSSLNFLKNVSCELSEDKTCGYYVDKDKMIVFIMLNSAWFSVGEVFLEEYLKQIKTENKIDIKNIRRILNGHGEQMTGLDSINKEFAKKIIEILDSYSDYLVITTMHHPLSWLDAEQRQIIERSPNFFKIISKTDLLLTGHEHVPFELDNHTMINKTLQLQGGCYYCDGDLGWFSILDVNSKKRTVEHVKIKYNINKKSWDNKGNYIKQLNKEFLKVKPRFEKKELLTNFSVITSELFKETLKETLLSDDEYLRISKQKNILYFFVKTINLEQIDEKLSLFLLKKKVNIDTVKFVFFDLFHENYKTIYEKHEKFSAISKINNDFDYIFDKIRESFFSKLKSTEVDKIKHVSFVSQTYPFWSIEKFFD